MATFLQKLAARSNKASTKALSHRDALARVAAKVSEINTVLDIGAARGAWSIQAEKHWPTASYHLLEAKPLWTRDLEQLAKKKENFSYSLKAASDKPGSVYFPTEGEPYAGAAFKGNDSREDLTEVPATTLDQEAKEHNFSGPFAIKLDTHGTEVDILKGATTVLKNTSLICIETYNFMGQKRFPEMRIYLQTLGFRTADIAEPVFRKSDASLWQVDFYLLRRDHHIFEDYGFE